MPRDYFYELSARQAISGHSVEVVTWRRNGGCPEKKVAEGFTIHRLEGLNFGLHGLVQDYPYLPRLPAKLETLKPDIIHGESHLFLPTVQAVRKAKKLRLPCVVTVHGVFAERGVAINFVQQAYLRSIGLAALREADKVVCLTRRNMAEIEELGCPPDKIRLVPNAVDIELFKPCTEREPYLIVWVGRFVPEKGVEYLVEAARIVSEKCPNAKFLLIGYGQLKKKIIRMATDYRLLGKSIVVAGPLNREHIAEILGKATVFVFPSLREGMPIALLEAMACELPVVVSDFPGVRDVIKHKENGLLVAPKNPRQLSNAILHLLSDEETRRSLGENARRMIMKTHSWETVTRALETVYYEAVNNAN
jgi:glycosyltransferase involved in cell wall biosynthesis